MIKIILVSIALCGCSSSFQKAQTTYQIMHLVDTLQTLEIAKHPEKFEESGALALQWIGKHPSERGVYGWAIGNFLLQKAVAEYLYKKDEDLGLFFTYITIVDKGYSIQHNHEIGLTISF